MPPRGSQSGHRPSSGKTVAGIYGDGVAEKIRIQYGGSVNKVNIAQFMDQPEIDGALG